MKLRIVLDAMLRKESPNKICSSCRMKEWRKNNPDKIKEYLTRNKTRIREKARIYHEKHRDKFNKYNSDRRKRTKYAEDKTPERRMMMNIRSKTRAKYPLAGNVCIECGKQAEQHHHTTKPITVDDFIFSCRKCHDKVHVDINDGKYAPQESDVSCTKKELACECDCHAFLGGSGKSCPDCIKEGCGLCTLSESEDKNGNH